MSEVRLPGFLGGGVSGAANDGTGLPVFEQQEGQTLVFRTLRSVNEALVLTAVDGEIQADLDLPKMTGNIDGGTY